MCGIYGCISDQAAGRVLEGLRRLEYRGYDSAGIAALFNVEDAKSQVKTERSVGYVSDLVSKVNGRFRDSRIAIGHTRWATHGGVNETNAHPHSSVDGLISVVHNGIIENTNELLANIREDGYELKSETDTELIVHLLHSAIGENRKPQDILEAFNDVISQLRGGMAVAAVVSGLNGILVARAGAPLVLGRCMDCISVSSDPLPLYGICSEVCYLEDGDVALISREEVIFSDSSRKPEFREHEGTYSPADPGIFNHMMLKEIHDQPTALQNAIAGRISPDGRTARLSGFSLSTEQLRGLSRINLVACGTAFYAAQLGVRYIRALSNVPAQAFRSSEFPANSVAGQGTLTIAVSQSGETKDTLDALSSAKFSGGEIAAICNVIDSTIARYAGNGAYLHAGPEYAVASTKAFTNMSAVLMLLAMTIAEQTNPNLPNISQGLRELPQRMSNYLMSDTVFTKSIEILRNSNVALFIGRGPSEHIAYEGALKMMEVSYLPCIAYPGGELKHGPIALIEDGTPVVAIAPHNSHHPLMEANIRECIARGAKVILVTDSNQPINDYCDVVLRTPKVNNFLNPFISIMPLHLLSYQLGIEMGRNVDRPRNLAKSVTVV